MQDRKASLLRKIVIIALFSGVYVFGYLHGHENLVIDKNYVPKLANTELKKPDTVDFSLFWDAYNKVSSEYVATIEPQKLISGAMKGMVEGLGDPFSAYFTKEQSDSFNNNLNGKFDGIGVEIEVNQGLLTVVSPLPDSPAQAAGVKPKDVILSIDDKSAKDMPLNDAVNYIRGKSGTKVTIEVIAPKETKSRKLEIVRKSIQADSVAYNQRPDGIAVVRITQFGDGTAELFGKYAREIAADTAVKGIILDLRNNPGGLLSASIDVASYLVNEKTILIEKGKDGREEKQESSQIPILKNIPLAVLVNEGSASASEIVAGALQDYKRGKIIGEKSFGKGSVQNVIELSDKSTIHITTQLWLTPNGRTISQQGISPDITITDDEKTENDEVIDKAVETLNNLKVTIKN